MSPPSPPDRGLAQFMVTAMITIMAVTTIVFMGIVIFSDDDPSMGRVALITLLILLPPVILGGIIKVVAEATYLLLDRDDEG